MVVNKPLLFVPVLFQELVLSGVAVCNSPASVSLHFTGRYCVFLFAATATMNALLAQGSDTADTYSWVTLWQTLSGRAQFKMDLHSFQID